MSSNVRNRKTARKLFKTLLETALLTSGLVDKVFDYTVYDFGTKSDNSGPVEKAVVILSGPAQREQETLVSRTVSHVWYEIYIFVLAWFDTELNSEDARDDIEKAIYDVLIDNATTDNWDIVIGEKSTVDNIPLVSGEFRTEMIPFEMVLRDD